MPTPKWAPRPAPPDTGGTPGAQGGHPPGAQGGHPQVRAGAQGVPPRCPPPRTRIVLPHHPKGSVVTNHRVCAYRREWARRLIARGNPPGTTVPVYGSAAWCALPETDPARIAAVVLAAESWAWQSDPLPPLPVSARGTDPADHPPGGADRQGVATPGDQPQQPKPACPPGSGSATPDGSSATPGSSDSARGGDAPHQGGHRTEETPDHRHGDGPATPGSQGGQP
ncbi:DUF2742 domain-containing protein [Nocardiopsis dassonvillei]|uniref:DUF2742 domain-containing protein n=1 Tax=Nocardiopsis dassonvillei TaxID=2014 RepID=UPI0036353F1C